MGMERALPGWYTPPNTFLDASFPSCAHFPYLEHFVISPINIRYSNGRCGWMITIFTWLFDIWSEDSKRLRIQPRSQGPLSTSRKYPGYGWSRVCQILADSRDVIEGRGWKGKVCLALSLPTKPSREWNLQRSRCVDRQQSKRRHWHIRYMRVQSV